MTKKEAKKLLMHHSFTHEDIYHSKSVNGFLGMLRPFNGRLIEENYHEVMSVLKVLADDFESEKIDKEIISALWGICHLGRAWAIHPDGMLKRNNLITSKQAEEIENWIEEISYATMCLLDGSGSEVAFDSYNKAQK